ncbi:hypothetical protein CL6EHI_152930 [Entamoeba histolytica]|uniref:VHS domain-containing protein n=5 Tax=Entamoeba histolytica TaxID=5759 RepID=C4LS86_ENTH1|nr:hypothetical protein EHI_152930 [Entamoeba histolytica HM-1:IMSS]EAL50317.1 hypothetical protein EHI_152930 [Entamoeba histolytica HM-1:IMSS]EMD47930.1 Hypothetical protein EHI5A_006770 [Entamoeba histolytica KU27]ENY64524.1 hypothetical protein EHI7A_012460 [Entamoeba histolytica HM-1:IMSS-A]GAT91545.1 hypothetical protein CL6EHI_152930 [Entamoeba histolytica]|eukprot:XP_655703.1 hypothetical protein EHI_152930 [Entamoeba histolytica HM-1:IMSS]
MSVKLSELVYNTISDTHSEPSEVEMQTIANAVERVVGADIVLRKQIEQKMRNYSKHLVTDGEMLNCLILANYVVQNSPNFRTQVAEFSFMALLQQIGKMKKLHEEANPVEDKVRELIAVWGTYFPCELSEYKILYRKYTTQCVIDPSSQPTTFLPSQIIKLIPHVEHNLRNISRAIETNSGDLQSIYNYAEKISTKFNRECSKCHENENRYDMDKLKEAEAIGKRLTDSLITLKKRISEKGSKKLPLTKDSLPYAFSMKDTTLIKPKVTYKNTFILPTPPSCNKLKIKNKGGESLVSHSFVLPETKHETPSPLPLGGLQTSSCHFPYTPDERSPCENSSSPDVFAFDEEM